jgi:hypothetical protein
MKQHPGGMKAEVPETTQARPRPSSPLNALAGLGMLISARTRNGRCPMKTLISRQVLFRESALARRTWVRTKLQSQRDL